MAHVMQTAPTTVGPVSKQTIMGALLAAMMASATTVGILEVRDSPTLKGAAVEAATSTYIPFGRIDKWELDTAQAATSTYIPVSRGGVLEFDSGARWELDTAQALSSSYIPVGRVDRWELDAVTATAEDAARLEKLQAQAAVFESISAQLATAEDAAQLQAGTDSHPSQAGWHQNRIKQQSEPEVFYGTQGFLGGR